tara:strand:- start:79 stop:1212 length:1134 start_codon:yes stop_codon:yes gene_type:complete
MAKASEVAYKLRTLPLGEHKLIDIIKIIIEADQYQKEGLFNNSPFGRIFNKDYDDNFYPDEITKQLKELFPNGLEDLWVDITYQRVLKLKKIVDHLRRKDMHGGDLMFNKMLCGSVDIAVRPNGKGFVWDGFRRCIIAILNGKRFIKTSIEHHDSSTSIEDCRRLEAFVYEIKNGESESMAKEELYKSGIVYQKEDALKLQKVIVEMCVDVLGTNPGNPELGAFSEFQDTVLKERLGSTDYLVQASFKQQKAWSDPTLTGYLTCGLAKFLDTLDKEDEDGNPLCPNIDIHTAHPNVNDTCEVEKALIIYAKKHKQTDLCANRLAGMSIESVAFNIGRLVMGLSKSQQFELLTALGFEADSELMNQLTLVPTKKALAA